MNFLSHHAVAQRVAPQQAPLFYTGNLLPDFLGMSGEGSLRQAQVEGKRGALAEGVRLHLATDQRFHTDPAFVALCQEATRRLREAPLETPLRRVFFYGHVAVELALDAHLLRSTPPLADDLFGHLGAAQPHVLAETATLIGSAERPRLEWLFREFVRERWIMGYATDIGCARRLAGLGRRIGHTMPSESDLLVLAEVLTQVREQVAEEGEGLLLRSGGV